MSVRPITEDDLHAFVDQALDATRQAEVADYLTRHPDVARRIEGWRAQRAALRAALASIAEEPVPPALNLAHIAAARRRSSAAWWRSAAAAVALLCIGAAAGWTGRALVQPPAEGIAALAREAADNYAVYAPDRIRPVELRAADRAALVDWAARRFGRPLAVPDLAAAGFRFMGGRLVATPHGAAVLFMYDDDRGTRLVLLTRPMAKDRDAPMALHAAGAVHGYAWADAGIGYSLVGPAAPEALLPLADAVRRQVGKAA
jgi:anti-sigma factor RsiW